MTRIGEILLERGWVEWDTLALALGDQPASGLRLCSLLVARGAVAFDHASRALGEQLGVAAALRRHLVRRDRSVAALLPAALARRHVLLPIGRMGNGSLIVCARDPYPNLHAQLARVLGDRLVLAVAPARILGRLVAATYPPDIDVPIDVDEGGDEFEIDLDDHEDGAGGDIAIPIEIELPSEPARVASRPLPVDIRPIASGHPDAQHDALDTTIASFRDIDDLEWLFDVVMRYVGTRWRSAVLLEIEERRAVGVRGHGAHVPASGVRSLVVPLSEPTLVRRARDERGVVDGPPPDRGAADARLAHALGRPPRITAGPVTSGDAVRYVLVVGEPNVEADDDAEAAAVDLELLVEAIGSVLDRL